MTRLLRCTLAATALLLAIVPAHAVDEDDLLPVDQAFVLSATAPSRERIEISWKIADGYYLYKHRIGAQPTDSSFKFNPLQLPAGKPKHDEFFGDVETYHGALTAVLTGASATGVDAITLKVKYQGCAEAGVCYPPQTRTLTVALPADANVASGDDGLSALGRSLAGGSAAPLLGTAPTGGTDALPLPPEQAFGVEAIAFDGNTVLLRFTPAPGYYLYRDKTRLKLDANDGSALAGISLDRPRWPKGVSHRDEHFGNVIVYFDQVEVPVPLRREHADAAEATLTVGFQGCQTDGICYPPMTRTLALSLPAGTVTPKPKPGEMPAGTVTEIAAADAGEADVANSPFVAGGSDALPTQAEDSRLAAALAGPNKLWALLLFFGGGLLLSFTPCVYPMIPILSGLIAGRGERIGAQRAFTLSFVYVLANALVFTVAGVVAGLVGANLQAAFQTPWVLVAFAGLFVALSLSMFGLYELQLPASWRARLGELSDHQRGGSWAGVATMGALSALIVGPCVAPPLAAAVLYISKTQDPVLGGAALFLLAMGMGAPLLAFGVAAGRGLPTSGPWMIAVQRVFGFVFIGLAIWMLSRILPASWVLALWGLLALAMATWLLSNSTNSAATTPRTRMAARFAAVVLGVIGAAQLVGALAGGRDPLQPLAGVLGAQPARELEFKLIKSSADLDREIDAARAAGKPLLFDFYADWCVACKEMEKYTFTEASVHAALAGFVLLKADVTANDAVDQALMQRFGIIGPPATLFFVDGAERRELRLIGFEKTDEFVARTQRAQD
ncbi:protein-disulfide reductase DsbD [Lysobacter sp. CFH 32150]|uniref:protein-disulfide reductase DsbD n=1 Tax=Lysobacter sp. CFH 32150 TaxID=2927128 RepID=UPI001FA7E3CB|nr:protein-disulfide reductase DsbD [Lysobacter sp. CFH 32150]MCI4568325.1 protein-disulfide reductase DsbD [Lysobacter sp. CFH 32150]